MNKHDNPQAFPHGNPTDGGDIGMTLRDYFAGQALAGSMGSRDARSWEAAAKKLGIEPDAALARGMYLIADAMLAERKRQQ